MSVQTQQVEQVRLADLPAIIRLTFANMTGVDVQFTQATRHRLARWASKLWLPLYFLGSGKGYKVVCQGHIVACGYLRLRQHSGYVYNVMVDHPYRRQGLATLLLARLEEETRAQGLPWLALLVDQSNEPARSLYQKLGFRLYHPYYWSRQSGPPFVERSLPEARIEPLPAAAGRRFYQEMNRGELEAGDAWASHLVAEEYELDLLAGGRYWRCRHGPDVVGCAWMSGPGRRVCLKLQWMPAFWGHPVTATLLRLLLDRLPFPPATIELHLGSSGHGELAAPILRRLGFAAHLQSRLLMLKPLPAAGETA